MDSRMPHPVITYCDQGTSQTRRMNAKLNPSEGLPKNTPENYGDDAPPPVFTEDVSLEVFMQHLRRLAVQPQ